MSGGTGYGVTQQGFVTPQLSDLQTDLDNALEAQFGADINTNPESFFGQLVGIFAERLSLLWQAMQDDYNSQTPDTAFGASLDNVGALRGIPRLKATFSFIQNVRLFGISGTPIPATTTQFSVKNSPTSIFALSNPVTLGDGQNCIQTLTPSAAATAGTFKLSLYGTLTDALAYNISAADLQTAIRTLFAASGCVVTGAALNFTINFVGAGTGGLMVQPEFEVTNSSLVDGITPVTLVPAITQPGLDQALVQVTATATGPIIANAGTLTVIATPITGLSAVFNTQDAVVGSNVETDNAYRARMNEELQIAGAGTVEAIRSRLLAVAGVTSALVYENTSDITDENNIPPHGFEAVVNGGSDADIANTIWLAKPAGIPTYGTSNYTITDSQGNTHVIYFSRPTAIPIYIIANLTINMALYPADGDTLVKELFANYINGLGQGVSVIVVPLLVGQLVSIPGITDAVLLVGTAPGPTLSDNIPIEPFQEAETQTTDITVNHV